MSLAETMSLDGPEFDPDFGLHQARIQSDIELSVAFAPIVDDCADNLPIHPDMLDGLQKTLGQRYAGIFERLPQDSRYKKFGEVIQGDIVELLRRIGKDGEALVGRYPHEFARSAEQCALENGIEDIFDGAAMFVGGIIRENVQIFTVTETE